MKTLLIILLTTVVSCGDEYAKTTHIDNLTELVSESKEALVYLRTYIKKRRPFYRDEHLLAHYYGGKKLPALRQPKAHGSGCSAFFIDLADGYLATNQHCIEGAKRIDLELANGKVYRGKVIGADRHTDVALLKVSDQNFDRDGLRELKFADQKPVQGDKVVALGAPLHSKGASTTGSITTLNHPYASYRSVNPFDVLYTSNTRSSFGEYIQHDALIQGGNSGGPLINTDGQVLGINSLARIDRFASSTYAVSYTTIEYVIAQLQESGRVKWGDIGVSWQRLEIDLRKNLKIDDYPELPDYDTGAIVTEVTDNVVLQVGDIVFAIDGKKTTDHIDASNAVLFSTPGDSLEISFIRDGKVMKKTVKVSLWHDPRDIRPITKITNTGEWGLTVAEIDKGSLFYRTTKQDGLLVISDRSVVKEYSRAGCYLVSVDDQEVSTIKQLGKYLKGKKEVVLRSLCFLARTTKVFVYSTLRRKESVRRKKS